MKGASHVTLIGDHMQLPAVVVVCRSFNYLRSETDFLCPPYDQSKQAQTEKLHISLFERLMHQKCECLLCSVSCAPSDELNSKSQPSNPFFSKRSIECVQLFQLSQMKRFTIRLSVIRPPFPLDLLHYNPNTSTKFHRRPHLH